MTIDISNNLDVSGLSTFHAGVDMSGAINLSGGSGTVTLDVSGATILHSTLDVTGDTSVYTFDSTGTTSLATGGGVVNIASINTMTTVKGTLNVDQAVTLDTTLDVTGDTSVSTFDSTGATSVSYTHLTLPTNREV